MTKLVPRWGGWLIYYFNYLERFKENDRN